MLLQVPPPTRYDLKFQLWGFPVRVHPLFWLVALMLGGGLARGADFRATLVRVAAVFVTILVHELGHALVGRRFGSYGVEIILHAMGGLAVGAGGRSRKERIMVLLAGPGLEIALGVVAYGLYWLAFVQLVRLQVANPELQPTMVQTLGLLFLFWLAFISVVWALFNLLPVAPLDGGQIMGEVLEGKMGVYAGRRRTADVSMYTAIGVVVVSIWLHQLFLALMFGYLAYMSYQTRQYLAGGGGRSW